jgi:signal peptidase I
MGVLLFLILSYLLLCYSLSKLFPKAGIEKNKAWIPGVNFIEWAKIIGKKPLELLYLFVPIVNIFTFSGMAVDMVRSFGKLTMMDSLSAVLYAPLKFLAVDWSEAKYLGPTLKLEADYNAQIAEAQKNNDKYKLTQLTNNNPYKKSSLREWCESLFFAIFAAAFIRMFLIEAFVIPTPSMEGSLNVGDYLFVSKAHYGIRMPMTIAMFPLLHNTVPIFNNESYFRKPQLKYRRLPGIENVEAGKPFVFNWPVGDSVYITPTRPWAAFQAKNPEQSGDPDLAREVADGDLRIRPVDKRDHYIKRCIGAPGDSLKIVNRQVFINGKAQNNPKEMQFLYMITSPPDVVVTTNKLEEWGIDFGDSADGNSIINPGGQSIVFLTNAQVEKLKSLSPNMVVDFFPLQSKPGSLFPMGAKVSTNWTVDNYGPIYIPKAGVTTPLHLDNLPFYSRIISVYEGNKLEIKGSDIYINDVKSNSYTFKQNYYWAMGDNRHNSEDSRSWGYVPEDHVVGKPLFIWFSTKEGSISNGINWDRIFTDATKN